MKNLINTAIVSLILLISNYALADFQDGLDAYNKQDYTAAFKEWQPLAKQGNADAQNNLGAMYVNGKGVPQDCIVHLHILAQLPFYTNIRLA
jgi:hypothetical protein